MMFAVLRIHAIRRQNDGPIFLIRVDYGPTNTCVDSDSGVHEPVWLQAVKDLVKIGAKEGAVSFLDNHNV